MTDPTADSGWYPKGFVNPADDPDIDWIVPATDDDPVPPEERLAEEPAEVTADWDGNAQLAPELGGEAPFPITDGEAGPRKFVQPGVAGISLTDYSIGPQQKGWGAPCTAPRATVVLAEAAVTVDARVAELVGLIMRECERRGYKFRKVDTGAYNCRKISGTTVWSNHAWAIAVDVNWQSNPYTTNPTATDIPAWMHNLWNRYGFAWGGDYTGGKRDFMHFEYMGTPQTAVSSLALARKELTTPAAPAPKNKDSKMLLIRNPKGAVVLVTDTFAEWVPTATDHKNLMAHPNVGGTVQLGDDLWNRMVTRARAAGTPPTAAAAKLVFAGHSDVDPEDPSTWPATPEED